MVIPKSTQHTTRPELNPRRALCPPRAAPALQGRVPGVETVFLPRDSGCVEPAGPWKELTREPDWKERVCWGRGGQGAAGMTCLQKG